MKYILQIFTGAWHTAHEKPETIIRKVSDIASRIPVDKVIIGWNADPSVYRETGAFLHSRGIQMLLWLPVFSEINGISEPDEAADIFGNAVVSPFAQEGEDFLFGCPSSRRNRRIVTDIYEEYFSSCGFDGVFLDKIRTPSFVSGISGVLSCGCSRCRNSFLERGVDLDLVRKRYEELKDSFFDMASWPMNGEFELADETAQRFFAAKEEIIADAVGHLSRYFHDRDMIVGLDLFAPLISRFVGQNYALLAQHADFIKPMLYRKTEAPAGIAYEYALFEKHVPGARGSVPLTADKAFLETQLEAVRHMPCRVYPGIEVNYREDIARTDADYIAESLSAVRKSGVDGAALCWNVMLAPESHIDAVARG